MRRLAERGNVVTKLSAFGTFIHRNDAGFIARMISETERIFGADRCLFGSNFPIEKLWTDYRNLFDAFCSGASGLSASAQRAIFNDTAQRVYRI
jgi:predicted TIM-barrel fold metal-dependent hydrolase